MSLMESEHSQICEAFSTAIDYKISRESVKNIGRSF